MKKIRGFTLTELMVALAVIGIITAIVTPAVMKIKPNKNKMMTKKAYYTAENIINSLVNNQLFYPDMSDVCYDDSLKNEANGIYCALGFDYTEEVKDIDGETYSGSLKFPQLFASRLNIQSGQTDTQANLQAGVTTTDGMTWYLPTWANKSQDSHEIKVDVNGAGKGPDCTQDAEGCSADDFDSFRIVVYPDGRMKIHDSDSKAQEYISINASVSKD